LSLKSGGDISDISIIILGMNDSRTPHEDDLLKQFGYSLRTIRKQAGLSQEDLATKAGFSRSYYTEIETGKRNISILNLYRLAEALGIESAHLLRPPFVQHARPTRTPISHGFLNAPILAEIGLPVEMVKSSMTYSYAILDAIDQTLRSGNAAHLAKNVELANLSSMIGNLLGAGITLASNGLFKRNAPHSYPDLVAQTSEVKDVEIKVALESNQPKGHLAKAGYYLIFRYVLCDVDGKFNPQAILRGDVVTIWEARVGYLDLRHFNKSNTAGDSGKTATLNAEGMRNLAVIYVDLECCPYARNSKSYRAYERLFGS